MTQGRGVDVLLSSLSGEGLKAFCEGISPFGRFIEIGKQAIESNGNLPMAHFACNTSFSAVDPAGVVRERPTLLQELLQSMIGLIQDRPADSCLPRLGDLAGSPIFAKREKHWENCYRMEERCSNTRQSLRSASFHYW